MTQHTGKVRFVSQDIIEGLPFVSQGTNLCQLPNGLSCMGCCGLDFAPQLGDGAKKAFVKALKQSTQELQRIENKMVFKQRYDSEDLHDCGMCRHLVVNDEEDEQELMQKKHLGVYCPLHPAQNKGKELRQGECDFAYMCKTQRLFIEKWDDDTKKKFLAFIAQKDPDWFDYSVGMHSDAYVEEFMKSG